MDRKFVIALSSLAGSLMLSEAHAIGLGEIRLRSALNEPLRADIKLVQVNDLSENEIIVGLAPKEDFDRAHVDRDFLLNSLRFRLDLDDPKNPKVVVTTQQPLREPFLNFVVEVQWPSGRLLREYTLLMDLPAFSDSRASSDVKEAKVSSGRPQPVDEEVSELEPAKPVKAPAPRVAAPKAKPDVPARRASAEEVEARKNVAAPVPEKEVAATQDESSASDDTYGPTGSNDTMWRIAQGVRGSGSVHQKILAIQRLNPRAFSNGNVNLLKKGQVLKLPSQEEIASIGRAEATAKFNEQNDAWKSGGKSAPAVGAQLDATGRAAPAAPAATQPDGQLKLATPAASADAGQAAKGTGDQGAEVAALQNDLAVGMEELSRAQRENQEIASRAKDLDAQKENAERLLQLQSTEMAAMQAKLAAEQQAKAAADAQAKAVADAAAQQAAVDAQAKAAADAAAQAAAAQAATAAAPAPAADTAAAAPVAETAAPAATSDAAAPADATPPLEATTQTEATAPTEAAPTATAEVAPSAEAVAPAEKPVEKPVTKQSSNASLIDSFTNSSVIAGVIAVVLILLGLFAYRKKAASASREAEQDFDDSVIDYVAPEQDESGVYAQPEAEAQEDAEQADMAWEVDASVEESSAEAEMPSEASMQPESGDVLGEADIYISFGNFEKGEALLKSAIKAEPMRSDYRLKLLELHKESGDLTAFDEVYKGLIELDDDLAISKAGELRGGISGAADTPFAFGVSSAAAAAGISDEVDFDLDLDMDFDAPAEVQAELQPAAEVADAEISTFFDVDFDLDAEPEFAANQTSIREAVAVDVEEQPAVEEEFSLDFDLDLDTPAVEVEPEVVISETTPAAAEPEQYSEQESAMLGAVTADAGDLDEELDFLSDADESATKLDLARAYIDMGDKDGARDILAEVLEEGRSEQKREAQALLDSIG
jgi:pilus assembly protein FimV